MIKNRLFLLFSLFMIFRNAPILCMNGSGAGALAAALKSQRKAVADSYVSEAHNAIKNETNLIEFGEIVDAMFQRDNKQEVAIFIQEVVNQIEEPNKNRPQAKLDNLGAKIIDSIAEFNYDEQGFIHRVLINPNIAHVIKASIQLQSLKKILDELLRTRVPEEPAKNNSLQEAPDKADEVEQSQEEKPSVSVTVVGSSAIDRLLEAKDAAKPVRAQPAVNLATDAEDDSEVVSSSEWASNSLYEQQLAIKTHAAEQDFAKQQTAEKQLQEESRARFQGQPTVSAPEVDTPPAPTPAAAPIAAAAAKPAKKMTVFSSKKVSHVGAPKVSAKTRERLKACEEEDLQEIQALEEQASRLDGYIWATEEREKKIIGLYDRQLLRERAKFQDGEEQRLKAAAPVATAQIWETLKKRPVPPPPAPTVSIEPASSSTSLTDQVSSATVVDPDQARRDRKAQRDIEAAILGLDTPPDSVNNSVNSSLVQLKESEAKLLAEEAETQRQLAAAKRIFEEKQAREKEEAERKEQERLAQEQREREARETEETRRKTRETIKQKMAERAAQKKEQERQEQREREEREAREIDEAQRRAQELQAQRDRVAQNAWRREQEREDQVRGTERETQEHIERAARHALDQEVQNRLFNTAKAILEKPANADAPPARVYPPYRRFGDALPDDPKKGSNWLRNGVIATALTGISYYTYKHFPWLHEKFVEQKQKWFNKETDSKKGQTAKAA